ncbi:MAG: oligosaccharide flippase family protein [Candidatus Micrarchaeota archaeon]|nr:oligosaccharide flippase family protein [Candidatus Micrarchaeota archaeon]
MKKLITDALSSKNFLLLNAVSLTGTVIAMGLNYLFQIISARTLTLSDYGVFGVIIGIWSIITIPISSVTSVFSREMAKYESAPEKMNFLAKKYIRKTALYCTGAALVGIVACIAIGQPLVALALAGVPFMYTLAVIQSYLQANEKILQYTLLTTGIPVLKLGALLAFLSLGFGLGGAIGALVASSALALAAAAAYLLPKIKKVEKVQLTLRDALGVLLFTNALMTLIVYMDLFAVKTYLSDEQAGIYNAAEITAKILLFLSWAIGVVLYPKIAKLGHEKLGSEGLKLLLASAAMLIPVYIGFQLLASPFMILFYGQKFMESVEPFKLLSTAMLFMGFAYLLTSFLWARRCEMPVLALHVVAVAFNGALLYYTVPSGGLAAAANATTVTGGLLFVSLSALAIREIRRK